MDKSKRISHGGNGKSFLLREDLGRSGSPGDHFLSPTPPREPLSCSGSRRTQSRVTKTLSPSCTLCTSGPGEAAGICSDPGFYPKTTTHCFPGHPSPPASSSISSGSCHGHIPVSPVPLAPCPVPQGWLTIPPATSSPLHKLGLAGLPPSSGNTLEMFTGSAPPPSCQKGLQDPVQIPKSRVHIKKDETFP